MDTGERRGGGRAQKVQVFMYLLQTSTSSAKELKQRAGHLKKKVLELTTDVYVFIILNNENP